MKRFAKRFVTLVAAALVSGPALAAINFSDDFESYDPAGVTIGGGWLYWANVFGPQSEGCWQYWYGYGGDAPISGSGFSNIVDGAYGQALNVFTDYNNGNQGDGCLETAVYQQVEFDGADADEYRFSFYVQVPGPLGPDVGTWGFVKLLTPGFDTIWDMTVDTETPGLKFITVNLEEADDGMILQWGFRTRAQDWQDSGRWYDNVSFAPLSVRPPYLPLYENPIPIPFWAMMLMAGMLAYVGATRIRNRRKA